MQWSEAVQGQLQALTKVKSNEALIQKMIHLVDLTSLNNTDTEQSIALLCEKAETSFGHVASVCVYPQFVRQVAAEFEGKPVKTATVANFPEASSSLEDVLIEINDALEDGAQEIDVVFPYHRYLAGERQYAQTFVEACKAACGDDVTLKVILETGVLVEPGIIADASYDVIAAGADFIKTSTGKLSEGATLQAAAVMLLVIKHVTPQIKRMVGFKASGGIREIPQAAQYIELADNIMGRSWVKPDTFRLGSSRLVDEMIKAML